MLRRSCERNRRAPDKECRERPESLQGGNRTSGAPGKSQHDKEIERDATHAKVYDSARRRD